MNHIATPSKLRKARPVAGLVDLLKVPEFLMFLVVIALFIIGAVVNPRFLGIENLKIMTRDTAILGIAAIGVGFTIITAGIDLSVGSIVGLGGVLAAYFIVKWGLPIWLGIILTLLVGGAIGYIHGLFVTKLNMHGFLITLVTLGVARGSILVITNGFPITGVPDSMAFLGQGNVLGLIPVPVIICLIVAGLAMFLLHFTYVGRQIYAVERNGHAKHQSLLFLLPKDRSSRPFCTSITSKPVLLIRNLVGFFGLTDYNASSLPQF